MITTEEFDAKFARAMAEEVVAAATPSAARKNGHGHKEAIAWRTLFRPLSDILAEPDEEIAWLVEGLVPRGWLGMIVADSKVGKTLLMLALARALGLGEPFLDKATCPGSVFLALVDDPKVLSKKRLRETLAGVPNVHAYIDRWDQTALQALEAGVAEVAPDLVVIDTLVKTTPRQAGAENDANTMDATFERFTRLTMNEKTTVILVHHENRAGGVRGSTAIDGAAPFVLKLKSEPPAPDMSRMVTLAMEWKLPPIDPLVLLHSNNAFTVQGGAAPAGRKQPDYGAAILRSLEGGSLTIAEMASKTGHSEYIVRREIQRLGGLDLICAMGTAPSSTKGTGPLLFGLPAL